MDAPERLAKFHPPRLDAAQGALYERIVGGPRSSGPATFALTDDEGQLEGPFNAMLINPQIGDALQELGAAIRYRSTLSPRQREIAILTVAVLRSSDFEWYAHELVGLAAGLTGQEIDALRDRRAAETFSDAERAAQEFTRALIVDRDVDDVLFAQTSEVLGGIVPVFELITLAGYYDLLSLSLRVWRTALPEGVVASFQDSRAHR